MFLKYYLILILWIGGLWGLHFCFFYSYESSCCSFECSSFIKYSCVCCVQDIFLLWYDHFEFVWRALQTILMPFWIWVNSMKPNIKMQDTSIIPIFIYLKYECQKKSMPISYLYTTLKTFIPSLYQCSKILKC